MQWWISYDNLPWTEWAALVVEEKTIEQNRIQTFFDENKDVVTPEDALAWLWQEWCHPTIVHKDHHLQIYAVVAIVICCDLQVRLEQILLQCEVSDALRDVDALLEVLSKSQMIERRLVAAALLHVMSCFISSFDVSLRPETSCAIRDTLLEFDYIVGKGSTTLSWKEFIDMPLHRESSPRFDMQRLSKSNLEFRSVIQELAGQQQHSLQCGDDGIGQQLLSATNRLLAIIHTTQLDKVNVSYQEPVWDNERWGMMSTIQLVKGEESFSVSATASNEALTPAEEFVKLCSLQDMKEFDPSLFVRLLQQVHHDLDVNSDLHVLSVHVSMLMSAQRQLAQSYQDCSPYMNIVTSQDESDGLRRMQKLFNSLTPESINDQFTLASMLRIALLFPVSLLRTLVAEAHMSTQFHALYYHFLWLCPVIVEWPSEEEEDNTLLVQFLRQHMLELVHDDSTTRISCPAYVAFVHLLLGRRTDLGDFGRDPLLPPADIVRVISRVNQHIPTVGDDVNVWSVYGRFIPLMHDLIRPLLKPQSLDHELEDKLLRIALDLYMAPSSTTDVRDALILFVEDLIRNPTQAQEVWNQAEIPLVTLFLCTIQHCDLFSLPIFTNRIDLMTWNETRIQHSIDSIRGLSQTDVHRIVGVSLWSLVWASNNPSNEMQIHSEELLFWIRDQDNQVRDGHVLHKEFAYILLHCGRRLFERVVRCIQSTDLFPVPTIWVLPQAIRSTTQQLITMTSQLYTMQLSIRWWSHVALMEKDVDPFLVISMLGHCLAFVDEAIATISTHLNSLLYCLHLMCFVHTVVSVQVDPSCTSQPVMSRVEVIVVHILFLLKELKHLSTDDARFSQLYISQVLSQSLFLHPHISHSGAVGRFLQTIKRS